MVFKSSSFTPAPQENSPETWIAVSSRFGKPLPDIAFKRNKRVKLSFPPLNPIASFETFSSMLKSKRALRKVLSNRFPKVVQGGRAIEKFMI